MKSLSANRALQPRRGCAGISAFAGHALVRRGQAFVVGFSGVGQFICGNLLK
jgi:hypothetical protein